MAQARVLAVDDQRYFRELIENLLGDEGYEVQTASSGEEALHQLGRADYDVVLTDLVMPGIDGSELCRRIKEQWPQQAVVMVTGVVDVASAVEAMKHGATDYILKPFDRETLVASLEGILRDRRLRHEHAQLVEENLEYLGTLTVYERALGLCSTLATGPLAERLIEGLCLETCAQSGVAWLAQGSNGGTLELAAARGFVRVEQQPTALSLSGLPPAVAASLEAGRPEIADDPELGDVLWVPIGAGSKLLGAVCVSDKLEGRPFEDSDRVMAERFARYGATAVANALRFRALERRSFRDPATRAYTRAYFHDVVRNEIQKASRFGRHFSLARFRLQGFDEIRAAMSEGQRARWLESLIGSASKALRATDLLAIQAEDAFSVLLPETDSVGAAHAMQRVREVLAEAPPEGPLPRLLATTVTYPCNGTQLDALDQRLERRLDRSATSLLEALDLESDGFGAALEKLAGGAHAEPAERRAQIERLLVDDVASRANERALLVVAPPAETLEAVTQAVTGFGAGLELAVRGEVVLVAAESVRPEGWANLPHVTWVAPERIGSERSFLLYHGDGPAYAMVSDEPRPDGQVPVFHTSDRRIVEHLSLQLQRDLGLGALQ